MSGSGVNLLGNLRDEGADCKGLAGRMSIKCGRKYPRATEGGVWDRLRPSPEKCFFSLEMACFRVQ